MNIYILGVVNNNYLIRILCFVKFKNKIELL